MKIFNKYFLFFVWLLAVNSAMKAQKVAKYGFELRSHLESIDASEMVPLLIEGDAEEINSLVEQLNGKVRLQIDNLFSIELQAYQIEEFSQNRAVELIEFSTVKGKSLSDTMLIQTNVDSVIRMIQPLRSSYTGKGVVLGVIDSGIELDHGDFKDSLGNTRVLYIWDQGVAYDPLRKPGNYAYGVEWDSAAINNNMSTHDDKASQFGHGSMVSGAAASNGLATGHFRGVAPEVNIISVATDFTKNNWLQTVAEAVDYIFNKADSLGMPCVINASVGTYLGSHDGKDIAARMIDQMIKVKSGRSFVCAAGNAGAFKFHLQHQPVLDTSFTWFQNHPNMFGPQEGVYFQAWSDTADFNQMQFAIGADRPIGSIYEFRGRTAFASPQNRINQIYSDSIMGANNQKIADVLTYIEQSQGRYKLEVAIIEPDSNNYQFRFESTGIGKIDIWSSRSIIGHSEIVNSNLPSTAQYSAMRKYQKPDSLQTIVSSFTCLPSVITVGNYINRNTYLDVNNNLQNMGATPGEISANSSLGPNRLGYLKPDLSSAGDFMMSAGRLATISATIQSQPSKVAFDSLHMRNGGTSMASPTVAGMIALYLEQCSAPSYSQIKNDLLSAARTDNFTGTVPTFKWGVGKADAFKLLSINSAKPNIIGLNNVFCKGDTLQLSSALNYANYQWSNGDTTAMVNINDSTIISAIFTDSVGCNYYSDTSLIQPNDLPIAPVIKLSNDSLIINRSGSFDWFYNNSLISSTKDSVLIVNQTGDYFAIYTDSNNCAVSSDTVSYLITSLQDELSLIQKITPNPFQDAIEITFDQVQFETMLLIYDIKGILVTTKNVSIRQRTELNLSHLPKGVYLLIMQNNTHLEKRKLIKH